ncbi:thioredoxin [Obba rivulosa]|uniref:Thioredoxin n=1 Tax=Obba rivulosa TaxID=1052685 RepID=A0A8E2DNF6_9APHY|nr:thioredoxin [Obba rivulosa]
MYISHVPRALSAVNRVFGTRTLLSQQPHHRTFSSSRPHYTAEMVKPVQSIDEFKQIISGNKVAVFDFWATWCGPCRVISPIFEKLASQTDGVDFYKVDVDEQPEISQEVGVRAMPTFIAFKNGAKIGEVVGANPAKLQELIQKSAAV